MNPDNKSLERTYFIGGAPRVGKSILAYALAKKIGGHVVSTDSIRNAAQEACPNKNSDLFAVGEVENATHDEWMRARLEQPQKIIESQNRESVALWPSIVSFCDSFVEDNEIHIVEGVAMLPSLLTKMKNKPKNVFYVGSMDKKHTEAMIYYAQKFPELDWMVALGYDRKKIEATANFVNAMSTYFKAEAEKYGFPYYKIDDDNFDVSIEKIISSVMLNK